MILSICNWNERVSVLQLIMAVSLTNKGGSFIRLK